MAFGERVVAIRKDRGLQQKELAAMLNIGPVMLSRYENNLINPSLEVAARIASALNVSLDYLAFGVVEKVDSANMRDKLRQFDILSPKDQEYILAVLDAFVMKAKLQGILDK